MPPLGACSDFGRTQQEAAACSKQQWVVAGSKILVLRPGVLTARPQRPAASAWIPQFLPALSGKNSGEETEGKEKS